MNSVCVRRQVPVVFLFLCFGSVATHAHNSEGTIRLKNQRHSQEQAQPERPCSDKKSISCFYFGGSDLGIACVALSPLVTPSFLHSFACLASSSFSFQLRCRMSLPGMLPAARRASSSRRCSTDGVHSSTKSMREFIAVHTTAKCCCTAAQHSGA